MMSALTRDAAAKTGKNEFGFEMLAVGRWCGDDLLRQFPVAWDQQLETLSKG
jgi:hypothetical protein